MIDLVLHLQDVVLAADDSSDGVAWLLALGPAGAVGLYWMLFRFYRNTDKSHAYERDTLIDAKPVTGEEEKVDAIHGTTQSSVRGNNVRRHRDRVQRLPPSAD